MEADLIRSKNTEVLGMVSHPGLCKSKTAEHVDAWCHCFRDPDKFINPKKPKLLLSESDFIDRRYIEICSDREAQWDAFYFTMGGDKSARRKGLSLFIKMLPELAERNMKVIVINYTNKPLHFVSAGERQMWKQYSEHVNYSQNKLGSRATARLMAKCRFGIFPNDSDCSPLLLTECLARNKPVLVNKGILGGWKYVNSETGVFFDKKCIGRRLDDIRRKDLNPREYFVKNHGFENAAKQLAEFGRENFKGFKDCDMACFQGLETVLKKYLKRYR